MQRSFASVYRVHFHVACSYTAGSASIDLGFLRRCPVLTCSLRWIGCELTFHKSHLKFGECHSPGQIVFETFRMCRITFHSRSDPRSAFLRVRLSHQQTTFAAQRCSKLRHHILRAVLFVFWLSPQSVQPQLQASPSECVRLVLQDCDQFPHVRLADYTGSRAHPADLGPSVPLRFVSDFDTPLRLCCCPPVRVLKPSHPSNQFTASFCGPAPASDGSSLPTWDVVHVHAACLPSHF